MENRAQARLLKEKVRKREQMTVKRRKEGPPKRRGRKPKEVKKYLNGGYG